MNAERSNDADSDELSFLWTQVSPKNPKVVFTDPDSKEIQFTAPEIDTKSAVITFLLIVEDSNGGKDIDTVRVKVNNLVEEQTDQIIGNPKQTNTDDRRKNELKELAEQAAKNAQSESGQTDKPFTNKSTMTERENSKDHQNTKQGLVQASAIPPGAYGFTVSRIDGKSPIGDERILDVDLSYSGQIEVTGDTWNFGPVSGNCIITYIDFEGGPVRQDNVKPTEAFTDADGTLHVESEYTPRTLFYDWCYWPAGNPANSRNFFGNHVTYTQENECAPRIAKGQFEGQEFGGGKWTWDITLPTTFGPICNENSAPTPNIVVVPSQSVLSGTLVTLDASGSTDNEDPPQALKFSWSTTTGVTLSNSNTAMATFIAPPVSSETVFHFVLGVTDSQLASAFTGVDVTVKPLVCAPSSSPSTTTSSVTSSATAKVTAAASSANCPPEAFAGPDQTVDERIDATRRTTVQLNGKGIDSDFEDQGKLTFLWSPVGANAPALSNVKIADPTFTVPNIPDDRFYTYTLTVSDGKVSSLPSPVTIKVISTKVIVEVQDDEIMPKIAGLGFDGLVTFPGQGAVDTRQTERQGGSAGIEAHIEGMKNPANVRIRFTFDPQIDTGGHDHLNAANNPTRNAFGGFANSAADDPLIELDGQTDGDGNLATVFHAENIARNTASSAAGFVEIKATIKERTMESVIGSDQLIIRVPGLVPLLDGPSYNLVGATGTHPDNHYGTQAVVDALQEIADDYNALHPRQILRYNDMSLTFGGVFDIRNNWRNPHLSHACGTDIDVGINAVDGTRIDFQDLARQVSANYPGAFMIEEFGPHHLHIHFEHC